MYTSLDVYHSLHCIVRQAEIFWLFLALLTTSRTWYAELLISDIIILLGKFHISIALTLVSRTDRSRCDGIRFRVRLLINP